jgi:cytochrome c5
MEAFMSPRSVSLVVVIMLFASIMATGCSSPSATTVPDSPAGAAPGASTDGADDQSLTESKCTLCHSYDRVETANYDEAGWTELVGRMQQNGLVISEEEKTRILGYLSKK